MVESQSEVLSADLGPISLRTIEGDAERNAFFRLAAATFAGGETAEMVEAWRALMLDGPNASRFHLIGAFRDGAYLGGYAMDERTIRIGKAKLRCGFIGAVVAHPDFRRQGVAGELMRGSLDLARSRGLHLVILNGLAEFYDQFGYVDMFDPTECAVDLSAIAHLPASPYRLRPATVADAPALIELYDRHLGRYAASTERHREDEAFRLAFMDRLQEQKSTVPPDHTVVAEDESGRIRGYCAIPWGPFQFFGHEVAADDWPALLAFLHHSSSIAGRQEDQTEIQFPLPPQSAMAFDLADHLPVRLTSTQQPRAGWMARIVDLPGAVDALQPAWNARWRQANLEQKSTVSLAIDGDAWLITLGPEGVDVTRGTTTAETLYLSLRQWTQVIFGFRPITWVVAQQEDPVPADLLQAFEALFPPIEPWIAPLDGF